MAVVITGFGACSPLGCSFEESLQTLRAGTPCVDDIQNLRTEGYQYTAAGEIRHHGDVVRTADGVDRKLFFLERALGELSDRTAFPQRYRSDELMLNIGSVRMERASRASRNRFLFTCVRAYVHTERDTAPERHSIVPKDDIPAMKSTKKLHHWGKCPFWGTPRYRDAKLYIK